MGDSNPAVLKAPCSKSSYRRYLFNAPFRIFAHKNAPTEKSVY
nr:MAG TPA: hypothetical protein [Ackermannviridae sp.]